jgi:hypothetical protein
MFRELTRDVATGQAQCRRRRVETERWSSAVSRRGSGRLPPSLALATAADSTTGSVMKLGDGRRDQKTESMAVQQGRRRLGAECGAGVVGVELWSEAEVEKRGEGDDEIPGGVYRRQGRYGSGRAGMRRRHGKIFCMQVPSK